MKETLPVFVLDSFAILAAFQAEPGSRDILSLYNSALDNRVKIYFSWINLGEVYYISYRELGSNIANEMIKDLKSLPITLCSVTEERILDAAQIKAGYPISYADAFAVSLAKEHNATLVTGDPEFAAVESLVHIRWLPKSN